MAHKPPVEATQGQGILIVYSWNISIRNKQYYLDGAGVYSRAQGDSGWADWNRIGTDVPSFYKDYATLDSLISAVYGMKPRSLANGSSAADADTTGIYTFNTGITGTPFQYGILLVFRFTSTYCIQLAFNISSGHSIAFRTSLEQTWLYLDCLSE